MPPTKPDPLDDHVMGRNLPPSKTFLINANKPEQPAREIPRAEVLRRMKEGGEG